MKPCCKNELGDAFLIITEHVYCETILVIDYGRREAGDLLPSTDFFMMQSKGEDVPVSTSFCRRLEAELKLKSR